MWEKHPQEMRLALAKHDAILRECIETNHGIVIKTTGDGIHAVFERAHDAVSASLQAQRLLQKAGLLKRLGWPCGSAWDCIPARRRCVTAITTVSR